MCVLFHLFLSLILAHFCSLSFLLEPAYNDFSGHADFLFVSSLNYHEHSRSNGKTINNNHQIQTCELVNQIRRCLLLLFFLYTFVLNSGFGFFALSLFGVWQYATRVCLLLLLLLQSILFFWFQCERVCHSMPLCICLVFATLRHVIFLENRSRSTRTRQWNIMKNYFALEMRDNAKETKRDN